MKFSSSSIIELSCFEKSVSPLHQVWWSMLMKLFTKSIFLYYLTINCRFCFRVSQTDPIHLDGMYNSGKKTYALRLRSNLNDPRNISTCIVFPLLFFQFQSTLFLPRKFTVLQKAILCWHFLPVYFAVCCVHPRRGQGYVYLDLPWANLNYTGADYKKRVSHTVDRGYHIACLSSQKKWPRGVELNWNLNQHQRISPLCGIFKSSPCACKTARFPSAYSKQRFASSDIHHTLYRYQYAQIGNDPIFSELVHIQHFWILHIKIQS